MTRLRPLALVVDDEPAMRDIVTFALETQSFETIAVGSAHEAWGVLRQRPVDLVVLDVMLPGMSGIELCRRITADREIPVILLTALGETSERIRGLEAGAADYVAKPFHPRELALRASGLVRRTPRGDGRITAGPITLELRRMAAYVDNQRVDLSPQEFRIIAAFVDHPGETMTFRTLLLLGWGDADLVGGRELLKQTIYRLRGKLEVSDSARDLIHAVRGVGYVFDTQTSVTEP